MFNLDEYKITTWEQLLDPSFVESEEIKLKPDFIIQKNYIKLLTNSIYGIYGTTRFQQTEKNTFN